MDSLQPRPVVVNDRCPHSGLCSGLIILLSKYTAAESARRRRQQANFREHLKGSVFVLLPQQQEKEFNAGGADSNYTQLALGTASRR